MINRSQPEKVVCVYGSDSGKYGYESQGLQMWRFFITQHSSGLLVSDRRKCIYA